MHYIWRCSFPEDLNCSGFFTANILLKLAVLFHFHKKHSGQLSCSLVYIVCEYISTYPFAEAAADVHTYLLCICMEVKFGNALQWMCVYNMEPMHWINWSACILSYSLCTKNRWICLVAHELNCYHKTKFPL